MIVPSKSVKKTYLGEVFMAGRVKGDIFAVAGLRYEDFRTK